MRQELREPAWEFQLGSCKVVDAGLEVFAIGIDGSDDQFVPEHEIRVIDGDLQPFLMEVSPLSRSIPRFLTLPSFRFRSRRVKKFVQQGRSE